MSKIKIYLADLFHSKVTTFAVVPLNLGYLASALQYSFGEAIEFEIFKYPELLIKALKKDKPHILALSNYTWNIRLHLWFAKYVKELYKVPPLIVMGGPNIRCSPDGINKFLKKHRNIDVYIPFEGEIPFCRFIEKLVNNNSINTIQDYYRLSGAITGCFFNIRNYPFSFLPKEISKQSLDFGSPYLKGILDNFIKDHNLFPIFETNRGCPYSCTFCAWGVSVLSELKRRDYREVIDEINYVAKNSAGHRFWFIADANFGILERDIDIAKELRAISGKYGFPRSLNISWAKNTGGRLIEIIKILKTIAPGQYSVQSMDDEVLVNLKRKNLKDSEIKSLIKAYHDLDMEVFTDILVGCSGETIESHYDTLYKAFEFGYDSININNIRLLPGTGMETDDEREKYGFKTKYRLIPNSYGIYEGEFVFEIEESIRCSNTLKENEMNDLRRVHFLIYILCNSSYAKNLLKIGSVFGINPLNIILELQDKRQKFNYLNVLDDLHKESIEEWFPSEESINKYYNNPKVYNRFINNNEDYVKLMWKYFFIVSLNKELIIELISNVSEKIKSKVKCNSEIIDVMRQISMDRLLLDLNNDVELTKSIAYYVTEQTYKFLINNDLIPKNISYKSGGFTLNFDYNEIQFNDLMNILEKYKYRECQVTALSAVIGKGFGMTFLTYNVN